MKKIIIGIPAYNEEKTIGRLLEDIYRQRLDNEFDVLVVSDNSSDMTDNIVLSFMKKYDNIKIIQKEKRTGKPHSLNIIFDNAIDYDFLILLDADIKLVDGALNFLFENFIKNNTDLVAGNAMPFSDRISSTASRAAFFGLAIGSIIKDTHKYSLYHTFGCFLGLSKRLYSDLKIYNGIGDDTFIYLYCMQKELKFEYEPRAIVYIEPSNNIDDYLKQSVRRTTAIEEQKKMFGKEFVERHSKINNKYSILLKAFSRDPYKGLCWAILYIYGQLFAIDKRETNSVWKIAETTKIKR